MPLHPRPYAGVVIGRVGDAAEWLRENALLAFVVGAVALAVGVMSVGNTDLALILALGVLVLGIAISNPMLVIALALAATLLMERVGDALSISDVVLVVAAMIALLVVKGRGLQTMAPVLWAGVAYLAAILPTTILNPYAANITEWVHDVFLVLGSFVVGFVIARSGRSQLAIGVYVVSCVGIAIAAVITGVGMLAADGRFGPVYLPYLDKNLIGCALAAAIIILYGRPAWFRLGSAWRWAAIGACAAGIAAAGSKQAMVGLAVGLIIVALRRHPETGKFPKLPWITVILILYAVWGLVTDQLSSNDQFNSAAQRLDWYGQSISVWLTSPAFGAGLRWWYTTRFGVNFQPPNLELEQLTTVGVVGLVALLALFVVAFVTLWRIDPWYGTVGAAIIAARFTESQFDLYWVAGQSSVLWIVAGICFGALERRRRLDARADGAALAKPRSWSTRTADILFRDERAPTVGSTTRNPASR